MSECVELGDDLFIEPRLDMHGEEWHRPRQLARLGREHGGRQVLGDHGELGHGVRETMPPGTPLSGRRRAGLSPEGIGRSGV